MMNDFVNLYIDNPSVRLVLGILLIGLILIVGPALHNKFKAPNELGFWEGFWFAKSTNFDPRNFDDDHVVFKDGKWQGVSEEGEKRRENGLEGHFKE